MKHSLYVLACSTPGCANDTIAILSDDSGTINRLCADCYDAVKLTLKRQSAVRAVERAERHRRLQFESLSPIEQWQVEGR